MNLREAIVKVHQRVFSRWKVENIDSLDYLLEQQYLSDKEKKGVKT